MIRRGLYRAVALKCRDCISVDRLLLETWFSMSTSDHSFRHSLSPNSFNDEVGNEVESSIELIGERSMVVPDVFAVLQLL